jgi:hypothetical protein
MEIILIIFIPCLIKQKEIPAEQRQVHYNNLLTTFDTFGNALKLTSKKWQHQIFFDNSFSEQNPKNLLLVKKL